MQIRILLAAGALSLLSAGTGTGLSAQTNGGEASPTTVPVAPVAAAVSADPTTVFPKALPVNAASDSMSAADFLIDGVPYAKVLYMEGNVWIRPPSDTAFHLLKEDEPIPVQSVLHTGFMGVLDFTTGPGMAIRMVPLTTLRIDELPQAIAAASPTATNPETAQLAMKTGTVFSALGREDSGPIDYKIRTPQGVAGARGTMFSTSVASGQAEVNMLHGTVNFETPDHQTAQIAAGQSQQIAGTLGGKFQLRQQRALNPAHSERFFDHAGGLLEHASGYGIVRRGLGPDVARTLHEHGYALPAATQKRFQNSATTHYDHRPAFNHAGHASTGVAPEKAASGKNEEKRPEAEKTDKAAAAVDKTGKTGASNEKEDKTSTERPATATSQRTSALERARERAAERRESRKGLGSGPGENDKH